MCSPSQIKEIRELNIGHFLIGEAIFIGLEAAIKEMRRLMDKGARCMIIGIGTDLVDISRIEKSLSDHGDKFEARLFSARERAYANSQPNPAASFAKRFAAKEAFTKAVGSSLKGLSSDGKSDISFQDIEVINDELGNQVLRFPSN